MSETPPPSNPYATPEASSPDPGATHEYGELTSDERNLAVLSHLGAFIGYAIPFGNVAVPLVLWLVRKDQSAFVADNARESLNFQISICLYAVPCVLLMLLLIGFVLIFALALFQIVYVVIAALDARKGEVYRYPLTIRFVS